MSKTELSKKPILKPAEVCLKVYDMSSINNCAHWLGIGMYHTVIQVHGVCYSYGKRKGPGSGIGAEFSKQSVPESKLRKSILIGSTNLSYKDVKSLIRTLGEEYTGESYHILYKNCNFFCNEFAVKLTANPIPRWVNRLARIGQSCSCVLPLSVFEDEDSVQDEMKLEEEKDLDIIEEEMELLEEKEEIKVKKSNKFFGKTKDSRKKET